MASQVGLPKQMPVTFEVLSTLKLVASWSFDLFAGRTWWSACTDLRSRKQNLSGELSSTVHKCLFECHNPEFLSCNVGYQLCGCSRYLCESIAWFHGEKQKFWCKICSSIFSSTVTLFKLITILINFLPRRYAMSMLLSKETNSTNL